MQGVVRLEVQARIGAGRGHMATQRGPKGVGGLVDVGDTVLTFCATASPSAAEACYAALIESHDTEYADRRRDLGYLARGEAELSALVRADASPAELVSALNSYDATRSEPLVPEALDAAVRRVTAPDATLYGAVVFALETQVDSTGPRRRDPANGLLAKMHDVAGIVECWSVTNSPERLQDVAIRVARVDATLAPSMKALTYALTLRQASQRSKTEPAVLQALDSLPEHLPYEVRCSVAGLVRDTDLGRGLLVQAAAAAVQYDVRTPDDRLPTGIAVQDFRRLYPSDLDLLSTPSAPAILVDEPESYIAAATAIMYEDIRYYRGGSPLRHYSGDPHSVAEEELQKLLADHTVSATTKLRKTVQWLAGQDLPCTRRSVLELDEDYRYLKDPEKLRAFRAAQAHKKVAGLVLTEEDMAMDPATFRELLPTFGQAKP